MQNKPQQRFVPCMQPLGHVLPNRITLSKCHRSMYGVMRLPLKPPWPWCYLYHNWWAALFHWVNMWLSQERKHNPSIWRWGVPMTFLALQIHWVFPRQTGEEHQKARRLSPSFPSPPSAFKDGIEDNDSHGSLWRKLVITQKQQRSSKFSRPYDGWGWKNTSSVTGGALQCIISTLSPRQCAYYTLWRKECWTQK